MALEELKRKFIINPEEYDKNMLGEQINELLKFCKIDNTGRVLIEYQGMGNKEKVKIILAARFLAHQLDKGISEEVTIDDISQTLNVSEHQARARISEVMREDFAITTSRGKYKIIPYRIGNFLKQITTVYDRLAQIGEIQKE